MSLEVGTAERKVVKFCTHVGYVNFYFATGIFICYIVFTGNCKWRLHPPLVSGPAVLCFWTNKLTD